MKKCDAEDLGSLGNGHNLYHYNCIHLRWGLLVFLGQRLHSGKVNIEPLAWLWWLEECESWWHWQVHVSLIWLASCGTCLFAQNYSHAAVCLCHFGSRNSRALQTPENKGYQAITLPSSAPPSFAPLEYSHDCPFIVHCMWLIVNRPSSAHK